MMYAYAIYIHKGAVTLVFTNQKSLSFDLRFTFQGYFFVLAIFVGFFLWFLPSLSFAVLLISHDPFWLFCTTFEATLKWIDNNDKNENCSDSNWHISIKRINSD